MWKLIRSREDWTSHQHETCRALNIVGTLVTWGNGPQQFPCLVASMKGGELRINTAYVYLSDAEMLLANREELPEATLAQDIRARSGGEQIGSQQQQFNLHTSAQLLTISHFLVETGICKQDQYERKLAEFVSQVDQWHTEDIEAELRKRQSGG